MVEDSMNLMREVYWRIRSIGRSKKGKNGWICHFLAIEKKNKADALVRL
jgi:ribosomal 30S subunit maturation factor RimM